MRGTRIQKLKSVIGHTHRSNKMPRHSVSALAAKVVHETVEVGLDLLIPNNRNSRERIGAR